MTKSNKEWNEMSIESFKHLLSEEVIEIIHDWNEERKKMIELLKRCRTKLDYGKYVLPAADLIDSIDKILTN